MSVWPLSKDVCDVPPCADLSNEELQNVLLFGIEHDAYSQFEKAFAWGVIRRLKFIGERPSKLQLKTLDGDQNRVGLIKKAWDSK